jgi:alpha-tubulin suppressor-like RCC1 family protein
MLTGRSQKVPTSSPPRQIVQGLGGLCVLDGEGDVTCWSGEAYEGVPPTAIVLRKAQALSGAFGHSCAIQTDGRVACWTSATLPARVLGTMPGLALGPGIVPGLRAARLLGSSFAGFSCVSDASGATACWGDASKGEVVAIHGVHEPTKLAATGQSACALQRDGAVVCWPFEHTVSGNVNATVVAGLGNVVDLTAGATHVCALHANGSVDCWGENEYAQLGNGSQDPVVGLSRVPRPEQGR